MRLPKDILNAGLYTKPNFFLCETDKEKICKLETTETKGSFKFNSLSELSFETARVYNDIITGETRVNPFFDKIEALRLIYVEGFGYFELQGPELISYGISEKKSCTAYSLEYALAQKYLEDFYINKGTVDSKEVINASSEKNIVPITLYNPNNPKLSLLHLVLEEIYGWSIGYVDPTLQTLSRQFDIDRESVYDFLMNEVCEKFNCYIVFDTIKNKINVYAESLTAKFIGDGHINIFTISPPFEKVGTVSVDGYKTTMWSYNSTTGTLTLENVPDSGAHIEVVDGALTEWETDVFVSFDNLAQEVNINYDADAIKTRLTVTYGDDYDIREVNLGLPYLTDISYYYTVDWMGQDLYDAYTKYMQKSNASQSAYSENSQEILKWNDHISYEENRLSLEYSLVESVNSSTVGTYYVRKENADGSYYYSEVSLPSEYLVDTNYYSNATTNVNEEKVSNLYEVLKKYFYAYFNGDADGKADTIKELSELLGFDFIEGYTLTKLHDDLKNATTQNQMDNAVRSFLQELWPELGRTPLKLLYLDPYKKIQQTNVEAGWSNKNSKNYGYYYPVTLFISSIEAAIAQRDASINKYQQERKVYEDANKNISDSLLMHNNFTEAQLIRLSAFLREDELHIDDIVETSLDDLSSSFKIKQDAMESGRIELQKISQPQLQFSMTMANIYALPEFEPIVGQFQLGKVIRVCIRPDYQKQSRLLQVDINFDDFSDFSCEFGELTSLRTQSDIHADLLSQAITAGKSVATNSSYWTRGSDQATALDLKIQQGLLDATTQIKAMDGNQGVVIDKYGIKLQKKLENGEIDPHQTWMTNNMILMSDDGFKTSRSALGEVTVDGQSYYGLIAEIMLAGYIEGSTVKGSTMIGGEIYSTNYNKGTDGTYIDLVNGDFELGSGKICYNSNDKTLTLKDVTIEWDSTNGPSVSDIDGLDDYLNQLDGRIQLYSQTEDPSASWGEDEYEEHNGDLWFNVDDGLTKRWNGANWEVIKDKELEELAQSKAQIFTSTPTAPYYIGDLWVQGSTGDIMHCVKSRTSDESYSTDDWEKSSKYTDDTVAKEALEKAKQGLLDAASGISLANEAKEVAGNANTAAGNAQTTADNAQKIANEAKADASNAETNAKKYAKEQDEALSTELTKAYEQYTDNEISEFDSYVAKYLGLGGNTIIGNNYVVSPLIEGGYLSITNTSNNSRVIIDPNNLTGNNYILQVHNGTKVTLGVDKDGNATFSGTVYATDGEFTGKIHATSLTLGNDVKVSASNINGLSTVATSGSYSDLSNKPTIPTSVTQLTGGTNILYADDVSISTATTSNGITKQTITVGDNTYTSITSGDFILTDVGLGTDTDDGSKKYTCISKDGLLTAKNAIIYGTVYATNGRFTGTVSGSTIEGGSININDKFIVDQSGNSTINSGARFVIDSGGTVQISAGNGVNSYINFGDAFSASKNGVSATTGNFGSLVVGGKNVLTEDSLSSKIVVSATEPNQTGIIWICPSSVSRVDYQGLTGPVRLDEVLGIKNRTSTISTSCSSADVLPNGTFKYTINFPITSVTNDLADTSVEDNVVISVSAVKSSDSSKKVSFPDYEISEIAKWEILNIEVSTESAINLCEDSDPINVEVTATSSNGFKSTTHLYVDSNSYVNLIASSKYASGGTQACSVYYKP